MRDAIPIIAVYDRVNRIKGTSITLKPTEIELVHPQYVFLYFLLLVVVELLLVTQKICIENLYEYYCTTRQVKWEAGRVIMS